MTLRYAEGQLTISKKLAENGIFHKEMAAVAVQFDQASSAAVNQNLADILSQAFKK
jgi:hypothetical protein